MIKHMVNPSYKRTLACLGGFILVFLWISVQTTESQKVSDERPKDALLLDYKRGTALFLELPSRNLLVKLGESLHRFNVSALSGKLLDSGDVLFIDHSLALNRIDSNGITAILPERSANAPLFLSQDQQRIAYLKPREFHGGSQVPFSNGIAIMNLIDGQERVLFEIPDVTIRLYGWTGGDDLIIEVPTWESDTLKPASRVILARLSVDDSRRLNNEIQLPDAFASLPALDFDSAYPRTSFDQRYIAYESNQGVVVASLEAAKYFVLSDAKDPHWTEEGLSFNRGLTPITIRERGFVLDQNSNTTGKISLPDARVSSAIEM